MGDWNQFGIAGAILTILASVIAILYFIVKYFVAAMTKKDDIIFTQHQELMDLNEKTIESINKFNESMKTNTIVTRESSDNITKLILQLIQK